LIAAEVLARRLFCSRLLLFDRGNVSAPDLVRI